LTGFATKKAIILSKAFRKITNLIAKQNICLIFTNQLREKVGVMTIGSLNKFIAPGGKALGFYASVRVRLEAVGQIKNSDKETIGIATKATVYKNRLGPPYKKALFNIFFDRGVSDYDSWIDWMVERKLLKNAKTPKEEEGKKPAKKDEGEKIKLFAFELSNGETVTFERKTFASTLESNQLFKDEIYKCMCDNFIMKYRNELGEVTVDDIEVEDTES
jgi:recombination protein RecA